MGNPARQIDESESDVATNPDYLDLLNRVKVALRSAVEISVPATDIRPYPDQPRKYFNQDALDRLSVSIDVGGQTTSGMVRKKHGSTTYELIDGERRWRAVSMIPISRRPLYKANLIEAEDDVVQYLISGIANFNREGHTALEAMTTIENHRRFGIPMPEIAKLLGISNVWANQIYGLRRLSPEVKALLDPNLPKAQQLPVSAAVQISKIEEKHQLGIALRVISKDVSLGRLRGEVVNVAKREGSSIRVREVKAFGKWESLRNKIAVISRTAADSNAIISNEEMARYLKANPEIGFDLLKKLENARSDCEDIYRVIKKSLT